MSDELKERVRLRLEKIGKSAKAICLEAELRPNTIQNVLRERSRYPSGETLHKLANALGCSIDWLVTGIGPEERHTERDIIRDAGQQPIPEIDVVAGMGGGGEAVVTYVPDGAGGFMATDNVRENWYMPEKYLETELHVRAASANIIEVQGDSMEPTLSSGDRVMINTADKRPTPPGIFALWDGFGVVVKRLEHIPNSNPPAFLIQSENRIHKTYERKLDEINIIGRVVWFGRRM